MITARELVRQSMLKFVGLTATLDDDELMLGMDELNSLISSHNDMNFKVDEFSFITKKEMSIGNNGWTKVIQSNDDGIECQLICKTRHNIQGNKIHFGDTVKNVIDSTELTITIAPQTVPNFASDVSEIFTITVLNQNSYRLLFTAPHNYSNGDLVIATNTNDYSLIGDVTVVNPNTIDIVGLLKGNVTGIIGAKGRVFPYSKRISTIHDITYVASTLTMKPDIIAPIPMCILEMRDSGNYLYHRTNDIKLERYYYNLDNDYPMAKFKFNDENVTISIKYKSGISYLYPEDYIEAPGYIITFLKAKLLALLSPMYNQDPTPYNMEADRAYGVYVSRTISTVHSAPVERPRYNFNTGDYGWVR